MSMLRRRQVLAAGAAGVGLAMLPGGLRAQGCVFPPDGVIHYRVLRKGERIGDHVATFTRDGETLTVVNEVEIVAKLLGIPVYRYTHRSHETWTNGWLTAVESETNKDGKQESLVGERRDDALRLTIDGTRKRSIAGYVITTSLWHRDTPFEQALMDIEDGWVKLIKGRLVGPERVPFGPTSVPARHYIITGEMRREVWYDEQCRLARVEFNTKKDGSRIILEPAGQDV